MAARRPGGRKQDTACSVEELFNTERTLREAAIIYASWEKATVGQGAGTHGSINASRNESRAALRKAAIRYADIARKLEEPRS